MKGQSLKEREQASFGWRPCVNVRKVFFMRFNHFLLIAVYVVQPTALKTCSLVAQRRAIFLRSEMLLIYFVCSHLQK